MKPKPGKYGTTGGYGLLAAMSFLLFVAGMAVVVGGETINALRADDFFIDNGVCVLTAEFAASEALEAFLVDGGSLLAAPGTPPAAQFDPSEPVPRIWFERYAPRLSKTEPAVQYLAYVTPFASDGLDNDADGAVDEPDESGLYAVRGFAHAGEAYAAIEIVYAVSAQNRRVAAWRQTW